MRFCGRCWAVQCDRSLTMCGVSVCVCVWCVLWRRRRRRHTRRPCRYFSTLRLGTIARLHRRRLQNIYTLHTTTLPHQKKRLLCRPRKSAACNQRISTTIPVLAEPFVCKRVSERDRERTIKYVQMAYDMICVYCDDPVDGGCVRIVWITKTTTTSRSATAVPPKMQNKKIETLNNHAVN